ncbi:transcription factor LRL2-like [Humulus lupulus]|uniref:transcription factor LRL2-like n=1 Tax=Humulus lupulus TaxID=3486 RepID=UPI002B416265|nr:transcription factor LRL2-like [Humulus lupulus]
MGLLDWRLVLLKPTDIDAFKKSYFTEQRVGKGYDSQIDIPSATVASPGSLSQARNPRIGNAERLKALQELLPQSAEGGRVSALDDLIDHIKYLQLQIKNLSERRLVGESPTKPIIFREGYGHYFCHQEESSNEPLEEIITAKWLEQDPSAVSKLLEMKGLLLLLMPID